MPAKMSLGRAGADLSACCHVGQISDAPGGRSARDDDPCCRLRRRSTMKIVVLVAAAALFLAVIEASAQSTQRLKPQWSGGNGMFGGNQASSRCRNPVWVNGRFTCNAKLPPRAQR